MKDEHGKLNPELPWQKQQWNKKTVYISQLDVNLSKKPIKCYILGLALCGAGTGTVRKVDQKYLESFELWCWRRNEKVIWTDCVENEEVLQRVKEGGLSWM